MTTTIKVIALLLVAADLGFCLFVALKTKSSAQNVEDYFIADKRVGPILLTLSAWASFSGAGNFIGQSGRGAMYGISAYWLYLGEGLCGGLLIGYLIAPYLARFKYISMPHYISDYLAGGDTFVRRISGVAALMPNAVWPASQIMGVAYVIELMFGIDYRIAVVICGLVFITYTSLGGVRAVIYADALHGAIQITFAALVIFFGLRMMHFSFGWLEDAVKLIDPSHWDMFVDKPFAIASSFLTGLVGATSNPIFWNRAFAAKDVKTARKAYGITFFFNILLVFLVITIGIATYTYNPDVGDNAMVWAVLNLMPGYVSVLLSVGVLAACLSCADTHLNCAAANIITDIVDPEKKMKPQDAVRYSKIATVCVGIFAIFAGLFAQSIYSLGTYGYTICGGVLIPSFVVGLAYRDRKSEAFRSGLHVSAMKCGMVLGIIVSMAFEIIPQLYSIFGGGVIPGIVVTTLGMIVSNIIIKVNAG